MISGKRRRILVVDDEPGARDALSEFLEERGFEVEGAGSAEEMCGMLADPNREFDLVILDFILRNWDRSAASAGARLIGDAGLPLIMVSDKSAISDRNMALETCADDFVAKPPPPVHWRDTELRSRIEAVLRRARGRRGPDGSGTGRYSFEDWSLDPMRRELHDPDGVLIELTDGEFRLLLAFAREPQTVLARDKLLGPGDSSGRSIDVHVSRLRRKLERGPEPSDFIKTVRGGGYIFAVPVERR
ncbi:MAG: response regulator transcription factor [Alphaproteobacteria bacterium]|nr:response regulator transcription factor [Alphaproteobacteria bacterium]